MIGISVSRERPTIFWRVVYVVFDYYISHSPSFNILFKTMIEKNKLFVGNLHRDIRWQELKDFCIAQGRSVVYTSVSLNQETQKSRGFGFVTFASDEGADIAYNAIQSGEISIRERQIYAEYAKTREESPL